MLLRHGQLAVQQSVSTGSTDQVVDDVLDLGLGLLHLLCRPLQTDPLLAVRELNMDLHTHTHTQVQRSGQTT